MKTPAILLVLLTAGAACVPLDLRLLADGTAAPSTIEQWDFNGNLASSVGGSNWVTAAGAPATTPSVTFITAVINGQSAQVASFTRGTYFKLRHALGQNGGGTNLNAYTLLLDVMLASRPSGSASLLQTDPGNKTDGDWFINQSLGLGVSGNYGGTVTEGAWNRLALVVDNVQGTFRSFLNGLLVQQNTGLTVDGRWSLGPTVLLFADQNRENEAFLVNSAQLRPEALSAADLAALGGPSAAGLPLPAATMVTLIQPNGGQSFPAGSTQTITWAAVNPTGLVQVDLYQGASLSRTLAQVAMRQFNHVWTIPLRLGDATDYRIKISSLSAPSVVDFSDAPFSIFGSAPPLNPRFGQALQTNGGFESLLGSWQIVAGHPLVLTSGTKGAPHSGARFFHGGLNPAGDTIVRQPIDLLASGFTSAELDRGAALDAEAWLRNWYGAGTFDDQVYYRVAYLDGSGRELASARCLVAADSVWLARMLVGLLPVGTRSLALEIIGRQRRDLDNDSMADDVIVRLREARATLSPQITKLPMLQGVQQTSMGLLWETDGNLAHHAVDWGRVGVEENTLSQIESLQIDSTHFVHRATVLGLTPETRYVYRVRSGETVSPTFSFRTAPRPETAFAVAWWGDNHEGTVTLKQHISNLTAHGPDLVMVAGDLLNNGNQLSEWQDYWFKPLEYLSLAQTTPVVFARGNHDGEHALAYAYSLLPGNESWFAFDYGNCRFIFLDSEANTSTSPEQLSWLKAELARPETQNAAFRIVCFHRYPYANVWNGGSPAGEAFVQDDWVPLFRQQNVDLVISGHAHTYNRGTTNGVTYIVSGGGGGALATQRAASWPMFTVEYARYHYDLMEVDGHTLTWQAFDNNNSLIDLFTLHSRIPDLQWKTVTAASGKLSMLLSGKANSTYVIESSPDLIRWTGFATNSLPGGGTPVTQLVPIDRPAKFLRARLRP